MNRSSSGDKSTKRRVDLGDLTKQLAEQDRKMRGIAQGLMDVQGPTLYGVDIVLLPEQLRGEEIYEKGKVVEINGSNSGFAFYTMGDFDFYDRFAEAIKGYVGDKKVLMQYNPLWEFHTPPSKAKIAYFEESLLRDLQHLENRANSDNPTKFLSMRNADEDSTRFSYDERLRYIRSQRPFLIDALRKVGVEVETYFYARYDETTKQVYAMDMEIDPEYLKQFDGSNRGVSDPLAEITEEPPFSVRRSIHKGENVGLVWADNKSTRTFPRRMTLNEPSMETITDHKMLQYFMSDLAGDGWDGFRNYLPSTFLFGMGLHHQDHFLDWMELTNADVYVVKPHAGNHGNGIRFYSFQEMKQFDVPAAEGDEITRQDFNDLATHIGLSPGYLTLHSIIMQELVPSAQIEDPETGKQYGACARAIVFNGKCIGAYWRSNKKDEGTLEDRFSHNLTNRAHSIPMNEADLRIVSELAESAIQNFSLTALGASIRTGVIHDNKKPVTGSLLGKIAPDEFMNQIIHSHLDATAAEYGVTINYTFAKMIDEAAGMSSVARVREQMREEQEFEREAILFLQRKYGGKVTIQVEDPEKIALLEHDGAIHGKLDAIKVGGFAKQEDRNIEQQKPPQPEQPQAGNLNQRVDSFLEAFDSLFDLYPNGEAKTEAYDNIVTALQGAMDSLTPEDEDI